MTARWIYTSEGEAPYYQDGDYIYSKERQRRYAVSAGCWRDIQTGKAKYYVADYWVYSLNGQPACYFR